MSILKKFLLVIIIILFLFVILSLLKKRQTLLNNNRKEGLTNIESIDYKSIVSSVSSVAIDSTAYSSGMSNNINSTTLKMPLKQLCIKGSYNSAYSGNYISNIMVNYVLSRGCRFLDFEVYYLPDSSGNYLTCVGYSNDPNAINPTISNTENTLFSDILKSTIDYAFINSNSNLYKVTNTNDPLFISIRMKTSSEDMKTLFDSIQNIIAGISRNVNYQRYFTDRKIDENTILESILGKVILVFEKNDLINLMGKQYNMISNSDKLTKNTYKQINVDRYLACPPKRATDSTVMFNCDHTFNQIVPDTYLSSQNNPNIFSSIKDYGNQVNMFQYYKNDIYLIEYENIFKTYNSAFVPLSYCLSYIDINATPAKMNNVVFPNIIGQLF